MKQGTLITKIVIFILFVGVVGYMAVYAIQGLRDPFQTVLTYSYTVDDGAETTGFLVREETVLPSQSMIADVLPSEGEKVGAGQTVAVLYRDASALDRKQQIRALELELEQLDYALRRKDNVGDSAQLDNDITASIATLKRTVALGDLTSLEDSTLALRSQVLKRVDTYNTTADSVAGIEASISEVTTQLRTLKSAADQESSSVTVNQSGIFSGLVDGYEGLITPAMLPELTVSQLDKLSAQKVAGDENGLGKLITSTRWYFAAALTDEAAARLTVGSQYPLAFSRDFSGEISMRIERIGDSENGRRVVIFSSSRFLSDTTLLRRQTVDVVFQRYTGVRVPKEAVRVITKTETDKETGEVIREYQIRGVYVVVGAQAELKPVEVVWEGEDFYLLNGIATDRKVLRAGDEVIITAEDLYDGKVVR